MKKLIALLVIGALSLGTTAPSFAATRLLTCSRGNNSVVFSICGVGTGCTATVTNNGGTPSTYSLKRKRETNGALTYTPAPNATKRCTFNVSALAQGRRSILNTPSCSRGLKNASCVFSDPT